MINAIEAAKLTAEKVKTMEAELREKINKVIEASIHQGSCRSSFFPRNGFEMDKAIQLLEGGGFIIEIHAAKDQRDNDRIEIRW